MAQFGSSAVAGQPDPDLLQQLRILKGLTALPNNPMLGGAGFTYNVTTGFAETSVGSATFLALPKDGNNARANINVRTGTFAALSTLVGGNGEIAKCTDQEALFAYDGTTPGGVVFRPDFTKGVSCAVIISEEAATGGVAQNMLLDSGSSPLAKGTLSVPNAAGIWTLTDVSGWLKITGYIFKGADGNAGAQHKLLLMNSDAIGGTYSVAYEMDLPPTLPQVPVNILFPLSSMGSIPVYLRLKLQNSSIDDVFGNAALCFEHIA